MRKRTKRKVAAKKTARKKVVGRKAKLRLEEMPLSKLKPHPRNPRNHPKPESDEWETLKASLEHAYFDPLVWNKTNGMLVSGHLRRKVMLEMGVTEADVVVVEFDEPTHLARMLAANRALGSDDPELLTAVFHELGDIDEFDLRLTGFTLPEIQDDMGEFDVGTGDLPTLPEGEKDEFQHYKFSLHNSQQDVANKALELAKKRGHGESPVNGHPSSNAFAAICEAYLKYEGSRKSAPRKVTRKKR